MFSINEFVSFFLCILIFCSLLSLASCVREYDYVRPTLTLDNVIDVTGGRYIEI